MKYSPEVIRKAVAVVDKRRRQAIQCYEENRKTAYELIPRLCDIDAELLSSASLISREALSGSDNIRASLEKIKSKNASLIEEKHRLLESFGLGKDFLNIKYFCANCNDSGFVDAMPCSCLDKIISEQAIVSKSEDQSDISFSSFNVNLYPETLGKVKCREIMSKILENCIEYSEEFSSSSPNLLLFGGTGIGKTHISLSIAKRVTEKGFNVVYISAPYLFTMLEKERFNQEKGVESMDSLLHCDLLVIDDLGAEFTTSFTVSTLYSIVNTRILSSVPTVITANLSPSELPQRYTDRIASRLLGCYEHLHFFGNDIRILKKKGI